MGSASLPSIINAETQPCRDKSKTSSLNCDHCMNFENCIHFDRHQQRDKSLIFDSFTDRSVCSGILILLSSLLNLYSVSVKACK